MRYLHGILSESEDIFDDPLFYICHKRHEGEMLKIIDDHNRGKLQATMIKKYDPIINTGEEIETFNLFSN